MVHLCASMVRTGQFIQRGLVIHFICYHLQVVVLKPDGITQPQVVQVDGNTIQAKNGIGSFPGLKISGTPGNEYQLVFKTNNGVNLTRQLVLRECQAGEHNQTQQNSSPQSSICEACNSPDYSFYPQAHQCGQCALLGRNSYSFCSGAAVVPANGSYQSHPRSPLVRVHCGCHVLQLSHVVDTASMTLCLFGIEQHMSA